MNFCRDRQIRYYCLFQIICLLLLFLFGILLHLRQTVLIKNLFLEYDCAVASSLLEQGVSRAVVAKAVTNPSPTERGTEFLKQIGITKHTAIPFLPFIAGFQQKTGYLVLVTGMLFSAALLTGTFLFFRKRDQLYHRAGEILSGFMEGDFSRHLPQAEEGTIYQFFSSVDQLAAMLHSKNDVQEKAKRFLKHTISDISHQLKTPLSALAMYQEIIENEPDHVDTVRVFSAKMGTSLKRMEQLIQSMLKIARLDTGNIAFAKNRCQITDLISLAINELTAKAHHEDKQILVIGDGDQTLVCDREWTREAIGNLVQNALEHMEPGGTVQITWEHTPAMFRIFIADNGCGIAPEDIHHIFKRFYRSKHSLDTQGVGLGLPLAKSIIEGQGGLLSVQSEYNLGTTFTISFLTEL